MLLRLLQEVQALDHAKLLIFFKLFCYLGVGFAIKLMFRFYFLKFKYSNRSISRHVRGPRDRELGGEEDPEQLQAVQAPEGARGRGEEEEQQGQSGHGGGRGGGGGGHHGGGRGGGGDGGRGGAAAAAELQEGVVVVAAIVPSKKLKMVGWGAANCRQKCRQKPKRCWLGCRELP